MVNNKSRVATALAAVVVGKTNERAWQAGAPTTTALAGGRKGCRYAEYIN